MLPCRGGLGWIRFRIVLRTLEGVGALLKSRRSYAAPGPVLADPAIPSLAESPIRIFIIDAEELSRIGLRALLAGEPRFVIVGESANLEESILQVSRLKPQVILLQYPTRGAPALDIGFTWDGGGSGPHTVVVLLEAQPSLVREAIDRGVRGIVVKNILREDLCQAVREVAAGGTYLDPQAAESTLALLRESKKSIARPRWSQLTVQERQLLPLVAAGKTNKEIAVALSLSEKTVKNYLSHLYFKLGVARRSQVAALYALQQQTREMPGIDRRI